MNIDVARVWESPEAAGTLIIDLNVCEAIIVEQALECFTSKGKAHFDDRMMAGDMARQMSKALPMAVEELAKADNYKEKAKGKK